MYKIDEDGFYDVLNDKNYMCSSWKLMETALQEGNDVAQMPNGDVVIKERIIKTKSYSWNPINGEMIEKSED